jgi:hypothetical protein
VIDAMLGLESYLRRSGLEESLVTLEGPAGAGESEQRLYGLDAWEESPYAALAWTEAVTNVRDGHVPDEAYRSPGSSLAVAAINAWNRLNIAARTVPGTYRPARARELKRGA